MRVCLCLSFGFPYITLFYIFLEDPERSIPEAANYFSRGIKFIQFLHIISIIPYKFLPVQDLSQENKTDRLQFCHEIQGRVAMNQKHLSNIIFTDEATFTTGGMFNRKNKKF